MSFPVVLQEGCGPRAHDGQTDLTLIQYIFLMQTDTSPRLESVNLVLHKHCDLSTHANSIHPFLFLKKLSISIYLFVVPLFYVLTLFFTTDVRWSFAV